jgi:hypothetical protein
MMGRPPPHPTATAVSSSTSSIAAAAASSSKSHSASSLIQPSLSLDSPSSDQHPRIGTESKDDILYLKDQLRVAGAEAVSSNIKDLLPPGKDDTTAAKITKLLEQKTNEVGIIGCSCGWMLSLN